eukprot:PhM_4_TR11573/c0_g1_i1/m.81392
MEGSEWDRWDDEDFDYSAELRRIAHIDQENNNEQREEEARQHRRERLVSLTPAQLNALQLEEMLVHREELKFTLRETINDNAQQLEVLRAAMDVHLSNLNDAKRSHTVYQRVSTETLRTLQMELDKVEKLRRQRAQEVPLTHQVRIDAIAGLDQNIDRLQSMIQQKQRENARKREALNKRVAVLAAAEVEDADRHTATQASVEALTQEIREMRSPRQRFKLDAREAAVSTFETKDMDLWLNHVQRKLREEEERKFNGLVGKNAHEQQPQQVAASAPEGTLYVKLPPTKPSKKQQQLLLMSGKKSSAVSSARRSTLGSSSGRSDSVESDVSVDEAFEELLDLKDLTDKQDTFRRRIQEAHDYLRVKKKANNGEHL